MSQRHLNYRIGRLYAITFLRAKGLLDVGRSTSSYNLHVDHIKPRSKYPELELDFNNLQVLCEDCNLGKSNKSEEDLRESRLK